MKTPVESIRLRQFHQIGENSHDDVMAFLQTVECATRADISGATGHAWASVHGILMDLIEAGDVLVDESVQPWAYRWRA